MSDAVRSTALPRFILLYAAMYTAFGVASPFLPALVSARGLPAAQLPAFRAKKRGDHRGYNSCKAHSCQGLYSLVRAPMPLSPVRGRRAPWPTSA
jgi:hypothetical protein